MRKDLYEQLQRLPVDFHDRWASGQLLSRATMDLQILRMFLAFPLVFLVVNGATILIGFAILFLQSWLLGVLLLAPAVPLMILCSYFESRYALAARRAQDQAGDLATLVEESVLGHPDHQGVRAAPQPGHAPSASRPGGCGAPRCARRGCCPTSGRSS